MSGKLGIVGEFDSFTELVSSQGTVREKSCQGKLFLANFAFGLHWYLVDCYGPNVGVSIFMAAQHSRCGHYIFVLFLS